MFQRAAEAFAPCDGWQPLVRLANIALVLDRADEALPVVDEALKLAPTAPEVLLTKVECLLAAGHSVEAMTLVQPLLDERPDGWVLAALAAEAGGLFTQLCALVGRADDATELGFVAPHRRERLDDLRALASIHAFEPAAARGPYGQLAGMMAGDYDLVAGATVRDADARVVTRALRHVLMSGQTQFLVPLLDGPAERVWPGMSELVNASIVGLGAP